MMRAMEGRTTGPGIGGGKCVLAPGGRASWRRWYLNAGLNSEKRLGGKELQAKGGRWPPAGPVLGTENRPLGLEPREGGKSHRG